MNIINIKRAVFNMQPQNMPQRGRRGYNTRVEAAREGAALEKLEMLDNGVSATGNPAPMHNGKFISISSDDFIRFKVPPKEFQDATMAYPDKIHQSEIEYIGEYSAEIDEEGAEDIFFMPLMSTWVSVVNGDYSLNLVGGNQIDEQLSESGMYLN